MSYRDEEEFWLLSLAYLNSRRRKEEDDGEKPHYIQRRTYLNIEHSLSADKRFKLFWTKLHSMDHSQLLNFMRMSPPQFLNLHDQLKAFLVRSITHRHPISTQERLAIFLRYVSRTHNVVGVSKEFNIGITTVVKAVREVAEVIVQELLPWHIPFPDQASWTQNANDFETLWNYPRAVGCLDGKHFRCSSQSQAKSTRHHSIEPSNFSGYYSTFLLAICDAHFRFLCFDLVEIARSVDSTLWSSSPVARMILSDTVMFPAASPLEEFGLVPYSVLCDGNFPLTKRAMRPFADSELTSSAKLEFNQRFARCRKSVDGTFNILQNRFQLLQGTLVGHPENLKKIILSCMILHNRFRDEDIEKSQPSSFYNPHTINKHESLFSYYSLPECNLGVSTSATTIAKTARNRLAAFFEWEAARSQRPDVEIKEVLNQRIV